MTRTIDENAIHDAIANNDRLVMKSAIRPYDDNVDQSVAEVARDALRTTARTNIRNPNRKLDFDLERTPHQLTDRISHLVYNAAERERFR